MKKDKFLDTNIINKSKCGFASKAGDYKHLAQIILKMRALHPKKRKLMGVKGYFYSSIHFNKNKLLNKFEKILLS